MPRAAALLLLCLGLALVSASPRELQQDTAGAASFVPAEAVYRGGLQPGWAVDAEATTAPAAVVEADPRRRPDAPSSLYAAVPPFGRLALRTARPFAVAGAPDALPALDAWLKGPALTAAALALRAAGGARSAPLVLAAANATRAARLLGPDDGMWFRLQVDLAALAPGAAAAAARWDALLLDDVSGRGFDVLLGDTLLLPAGPPGGGGGEPGAGGVEPACVGAACSPALGGAVRTRLVPLYGVPELATAAEAEPARPPPPLIARLRDGAGAAAAAARVCAALAAARGAAAGACRGAPAADGWPFLALNVSTAAGLAALRAALPGVVEYFDVEAVAVASAPPAFAAGQAPTSSSPAKSSPPSKEKNTTAAARGGGVPWGLDRLDQPRLPLDGRFAPRLTGAGVHVYVLDTGLRAGHADFAGRLGEGADCSSGACAPGAPAPDGQGHGTHVAGTAAGAAHGVARGATLHAVKVLGDGGAGGYAGIIAGLAWVRAHAAANRWRAVVNMSLGGPASRALNDAVAAAAAAGVAVVAAAGNDGGADACAGSPSGAADAVTVAASDAADRRSAFSNVGGCVDIFAPGSQIVSASCQSDTGERTLSGTSMASPHVAGAAALVLQARPGATPREVAAILDAAAARIVFDASSPARLLQTPGIDALLGAPAPAPAPAPASPPASTPAPPAAFQCTDVIRKGWTSTCAAIAAQNFCREAWAEGWCNRACGRACGCDDLPPEELGATAATCDVLRAERGCAAMRGACRATCGTCDLPAAAG